MFMLHLQLLMLAQTSVNTSTIGSTSRYGFSTIRILNKCIKSTLTISFDTNQTTVAVVHLINQTIISRYLYLLLRSTIMSIRLP